MIKRTVERHEAGFAADEKATTTLALVADCFETLGEAVQSCGCRLPCHVWVPGTRLTPADLLLLCRRKPGMIPQWRCS
jgi:hypothetical protein